MGEIHEGVCGAHQSAFKMKWMIRRNGYYWATILEDCFKYFKGVKDVRNLAIFKGHPHRPLIPLLNLGRSGDGLLI